MVDPPFPQNHSRLSGYNSLLFHVGQINTAPVVVIGLFKNLTEMNELSAYLFKIMALFAVVLS
jgi:hypothetical protein